MAWLTPAITLFLVMDPFGNLPILAGLLEQVEPRRRRRVILRECLIALAILVLFLLAGPRLMALLGIEQPSLSIAGGVVLMLIALRMLFPGKGGVMGEEAGGGEPFIVPLATPLIAGPSAIATVVLLHGASFASLGRGLAAIGSAWGLTTCILLLSPELVRWMGHRLTLAAERLTGLLLSVIAVQMVMGGIEAFIRAL